MKTILIILSIIHSTFIFAQTPKNNEMFSVAQNRTIINMIDDVCGDTWCEGDYGFKFNKFSCDKLEKQCKLNFNLIKFNDDDSQILSDEKSCIFHNITSFEQLADSKYSLNEKFYDQVTECIDQIEDSIKF